MVAQRKICYEKQRVRYVEVSIVKEILHVSTKGILVCHTSVDVKFDGVLDYFSGTVKIKGFNTSSRSESRQSGYHVSYGST